MVRPLRQLFLVIASTLMPAPLAADALEKTDLFVAGEEGYKLYRIPGIVVTKQGTVLAYCEARKSDSGDWGPIDVYLRRSTDGGRTWLPRQQLVHLEGDLPMNPVAVAQKLDKPGDNTVNNPVAIVDQQSGAVHFLYCLEYMRCFYLRSDDDGVTWTEPVEITATFDAFRPDYDWKVLATGPGHGIQLTKGEHQGRLIVPVWLSLGTGGHAHRPSVAATIFSDDHGRTWQRGEIAVPDTQDFIFPSETVAVQLSDGRVMLNSRSESKRHRRLVTISPDGATRWSLPQFDDALLEPICMGAIVRVREPQGDQPGLIAFSNPHNLARRDGKEAEGRNRDRVNLSVKLSYDEGRAWSANRSLEPGFSGYSDLAALRDGTILCFYERGSTDGINIYRTGRLTVARFDERWVQETGDEGDPGVPGEPAPGVQAYCFRLCLTTAEDRLPILPPSDYDARRYELVARFITGCQAMGDDMDLRWFSKHDPLPNNKWDFNTATFGGNLPGASWEWPEASYARRAEIAREIENYHRGLLHFLATDPSVPRKVREEVLRFGLPRDEFPDNGGWPHQLYVREGRRMISDLVMTEHHTFGREVAPQSIGLGSYGTDTHEIRRIVKDGAVTREGKTATGRGGADPYPIGYGAVVPKRQECDNLLVTFALSASHTAFSSIRMEPVFMITSQSAATAACLAIDEGLPVQLGDYGKLRARLVADGQVLQWPTGAVAASGFSEPPRTEQTQEVAALRRQMAAAVSVSPLAKKTVARSGPDAAKTRRSDEPVRLAADAPPAAVDGQSYDVVVVGGTSGGIACAVRAAREGCTVLLVQHNAHIGGMMTNGLMQWDALYGGPRSPLFTELLGNIENYYISTFGRDSPDHQTIRYTHEHYPIGWAEPHVAEREFNRLVAGEKAITLLLNHFPAAVQREGSLLKSVTLQRLPKPGAPVNQSGSVHVTGTTFVDATYEGDLFALAHVPYRVGREAREEYGEPHAGKTFVNIAHSPPESVIREGLNIRPYSSRQGTVDSASPFTADGAVQAYNYRFCVTSDPDNRTPIPKPAGYNREEFVNYERKYIASHNGPNFKSHVNSPILPGENHAYPEADWPAREAIIQRHLDFGLGLMWFLQNDESIAPAAREKFRAWGLPKDEYADNGHVPYEMYVREARRIVGRHVLTEHDGMLAREYARTPIQPDSIAVTDWYMDSHSCTTDSRPDYKYDGKLILTEESRPAQIPYRALLPQGVDNLLVPVCLSATHVAWGAIRLEPVFMQTGEAAGFAAALAKREGTTPAALDSDRLVRTLVRQRQLVSFFNDIKVTDADPAIPAAQYFGAQGFFHDYNARLREPLTEAVAEVWAEGLARLRAGTLQPRAMAAQVQRAESAAAPPTSHTRGEMLQEMWNRLNAN